jgi:superfamily II DNA/RNA helicase
VHRSGRTARAGARDFINSTARRRVQEIADFEKNWESNSQNLKPSALSIEETILFYGQNKYSKPNPTMRWMRN